MKKKFWDPKKKQRLKGIPKHKSSVVGFECNTKGHYKMERLEIKRKGKKRHKEEDDGCFGGQSNMG